MDDSIGLVANSKCCLRCTCKELSANDPLTLEEEIVLADLIYDTDPYIYPAMFESREKAEKLLPVLFRSKDSMFRMDNFFVAIQEGKIAALLLWKEGKLFWTPQILREVASQMKIMLSPYLEMVAREYVDSYDANETINCISLINLCVAKDYRGKGIGRDLLTQFIERHPGYILELCVLEDNKNALCLYESLGFEIIERYNGFSIDHKYLSALRMQRR